MVFVFLVCSVPGVVNHTTVDISNKKFRVGATLTITCSTGFVFHIQNQGAVDVICRANGWHFTNNLPVRTFPQCKAGKSTVDSFMLGNLKTTLLNLTIIKSQIQ